MRAPHLHVLATGGTIAGTTGSATARDYVAGELGIERMLDGARGLDLDVILTGQQVASVGSQDIAWSDWQALHHAALAAMGDPAVDGIIVTHGTDTAEETAWLLDLTLPTAKPVVLVGAMRPAGSVGADGLRNFANGVRVARDPDATGRGVLLVMADKVFTARDVRKAATGGADAFRGFPRGNVAAVTPASLDWFAEPQRKGEAARFALPGSLPRVEIIHIHAAMDALSVNALRDTGARGLVIAGFGQGNAPRAVLDALTDAATAGVAVVRASRVEEGFVDRNIEVDDDARKFIAARSFNPQKARILLQLLLAAGTTGLDTLQDAFDRR